MLVSIKRAARALDVSEDTIFRLAERGDLRLVKLTARTVRVRQEDLVALIERRTEGSAPAPLLALVPPAPEGSADAAPLQQGARLLGDRRARHPAQRATEAPAPAEPDQHEGGG